MDKPTDRTVYQNAWVVDDLDAAMNKWVNELGVGPFFVTEYGDQFASLTYRGKPAEISMRIGVSQAGPLQIELIQALALCRSPVLVIPCGKTLDAAMGEQDPRLVGS